MDLVILLCFFSYFPSTLHDCSAFYVISLTSFLFYLIFFLLSNLKFQRWFLEWDVFSGDRPVVAMVAVSFCCLTYWLPSSSWPFLFCFCCCCFCLSQMPEDLPWPASVEEWGSKQLWAVLCVALGSLGHPSSPEMNPSGSCLGDSNLWLPAPREPVEEVGALTTQWEQSASVLSYVIAQSQQPQGINV